jgi:hypothetical protein
MDEVCRRFRHNPKNLMQVLDNATLGSIALPPDLFKSEATGSLIGNATRHDNTYRRLRVFGGPGIGTPK